MKLELDMLTWDPLTKTPTKLFSKLELVMIFWEAAKVTAVLLHPINVKPLMVIGCTNLKIEEMRLDS